MTDFRSHPDPAEWDDYVDFESTSWPKKDRRRYWIIPSICFNCESACGVIAYVDKETLDVRKIENLKDGQEVVGSRTRVKVVKNKVAPPFRQAEFDVMYGEGISREGDLVDQGVEHKLVEKSGTWFAFGGERLGQGRENAKLFLKQNPDIAAKIEAKLRQAMGLADAPADS